MAIDTDTPRSRRGILAAGLGGLAATVAHALGRPAATRAAGETMLAGSTNTTDATTILSNTAAGAGFVVTGADATAPAVQAANGANGTGLLSVSGAGAVTAPAKVGVYGTANQDANARGIWGRSTVGTGVRGESSSAIGVHAKSGSGTGIRAESTSGTAALGSSSTGRAVVGTSASTTQPAIAGLATGGHTGVLGFSGSGVSPSTFNEVGVQGVARTSEGSTGVLGESGTGVGVAGLTEDGTGVYGAGYWGVYANGVAAVVGDTFDGTGVLGWTGAGAPPPTPTKVGVWAGAEAGSGRYALIASGVARFSRSGKATVAVGTSSIAVTVPHGLSSGAFAIATPQTNRAGYYVQAVVPSTATGKITIYLNKAVTTSAIVVGWIVFS